MNTFIILVCGINIRAHNRITLADQLRLLQTCPELMSINHAGDKGSYLVTTKDDAPRTVETVLCALRKQRSTISGAAVCQCSEIQSALKALTDLLSDRYDQYFNKDDFGLKIEGEKWRAGLALPLYPMKLPKVVLPFHKTKNAMIFGATDGAVLVAKREAQNVHWGTSVTDPSERQIKRISNCSVTLTSRSANIMNDLLTYSRQETTPCQTIIS
jgi:hypothetical protein